MCTVQSQNSSFLLANIYAPNKDSPGYYEDVYQSATHRCEKIVVIGDHNTVLDAELDSNTNSQAHPQSAKRLEEIMESKCCSDVWRMRNPGLKRFSWYRTRPKLTASRLDYALISTGLCGLCS